MSPKLEPLGFNAGRARANNELRFDRDCFGYGDLLEALMRRNNVSAAMTPIRCRGCRTGGQRRILKSRALNVVKATTETSSRHAATRFAKGMDRADCRNIVEGKKRGEWASRREQLSRHFVTQLRRRRLTLELSYQRVFTASPMLSAVAARSPSEFPYPN